MTDAWVGRQTSTLAAWLKRHCLEREIAERKNDDHKNISTIRDGGIRRWHQFHERKQVDNRFPERSKLEYYTLEYWDNYLMEVNLENAMDLGQSRRFKSDLQTCRLEFCIVVGPCPFFSTAIALSIAIDSNCHRLLSRKASPGWS